MGGESPEKGSLVGLMHSGLVKMAPIPSVVQVSIPVSRLLLTWMSLPRQTRLQRRDRCMLLLAILLAARPIDLLRLSQDKTSVIAISETVVQLRFIGDKGSQLRGAVASRVISIPRDPLIDLGQVLGDYMAEIGDIDISISPLTHKVPLFFCMDAKRLGSPMKVETVSKVLTKFLRRSGAPKGVSARHMRAFVASSAYELGASVQAVCLHCRWESPTTFFRFYLKTDSERRLKVLPVGGRDGSIVPMVMYAVLRRLLPGESVNPPPLLFTGISSPRPQPVMGLGR